MQEQCTAHRSGLLRRGWGCGRSLRHVAGRWAWIGQCSCKPTLGIPLYGYYLMVSKTRDLMGKYDRPRVCARSRPVIIGRFPRTYQHPRAQLSQYTRSHAQCLEMEASLRFLSSPSLLCFVLRTACILHTCAVAESQDRASFGPLLPDSGPGGSFLLSFPQASLKSSTSGLALQFRYPPPK
ncbi:hypothetical protein L209DRAFT_254575 [Thermothelomyces heterothallicus CBS 203.75]